jgi:hypothetical protein
LPQNTPRTAAVTRSVRRLGQSPSAKWGWRQPMVAEFGKFGLHGKAEQVRLARCKPFTRSASLAARRARMLLSRLGVFDAALSLPQIPLDWMK